MPDLEFCKFHGFGNDYIVVEEKAMSVVSGVAEFARAICDRHRGVGGDGVAIIEEATENEADFHCRIFNPDGSEAGFSGNGTRCAVAYLYFKDIWSDQDLELETPSGLKQFRFLGRSGNQFGFRSKLGTPAFEASKIPFTSETVGPDEPVVGYKTRLGVREYEITCLNTGNPVCVVFVDDFSFNWRRVGRLLENDAHFPERTNVVFVKVRTRREIDIRIWERGAGETSSSGTCSIGAAVASAYTGKTDREIDVVAPGGITKSLWDEDDVMVIEGTAELAFTGRFSIIDRD
ncbi:MAG: diaminopimelate epimerase [Acidobacteria bacterium]|nr:MAG: diaminopimelate epimerase [Acidobacteriota bacterium]REK03021.1 MAG: diaminopimelate epimerase [Acidobacteriota bacterium]REK13175.1 MAG: diaminopimelate epimerase [Acidobacteriota bacterium]REK41169.1 MAG: diaminopimelate epimerase [Acidobacteriota bacterium]